LIVVGVAVAVALKSYLADDFVCLYAAGRAILNGTNAYAVPAYLSPIHVAILFAPLALLPFDLAYRLHGAVCAMVFVYVFWTLTKSQRRQTLALIAAPFMWLSIQSGNMEWMPFLGLLLPSPWNVLFLMTKPQMGLIASGVIIVAHLRQHRWRQSILAVLLVGVTYGVSLLLGMNWSEALRPTWNISAWPVGLLIGIPLGIYAVWQNDLRAGLAAAPLISPYASPMTWSAVTPWLVQKRWGVVVVPVLSWLLIIFWRKMAAGW
jgi:hypothetical protein